MEQILLAYGLPKETVEVIKILYKNTKMKVRSPDGDTEYFGITHATPKPLFLTDQRRNNTYQAIVLLDSIFPIRK